MHFRYLNESDKEQLESLIESVERKLPDEAWWPPIRDEVRNHFFDRDWTRIIGCFDGDELVAGAMLFLEPYTYDIFAEAIGLDPGSVAEIGRCMVRSSQRGSNLMLSMTRQLVDRAYSKEREWIIAEVHPDNLAGRKSLERLGMRETGQIVQDGVYPRIIYAMQI